VAALRKAMIETRHPPRPFRIFAGFGGQIGAVGTAHHHQDMVDPVLASGDLVITQVGAVIGGYHSELERTMIVGIPSAEARDLFRVGEEMHARAIDLIKPGAVCAEIDATLRARFEQLGLKALWRHHTGHSIGICPHEAPFLDVGDATVLEPGMIVTVEPGLYQEGIGGFRHSDCVLVTERGHQVLTQYPRDLLSLSGL
jgi:Xaa-Pro aminopeptidase